MLLDVASWQITDMASDVEECCSLARRVALKLADALEYGDPSMVDTRRGTRAVCMSPSTGAYALRPIIGVAMFDLTLRLVSCDSFANAYNAYAVFC